MHFKVRKTSQGKYTCTFFLLVVFQILLQCYSENMLHFRLRILLTKLHIIRQHLLMKIISIKHIIFFISFLLWNDDILSLITWDKKEQNHEDVFIWKACSFRQINSLKSVESCFWLDAPTMSASIRCQQSDPKQWKFFDGVW